MHIGYIFTQDAAGGFREQFHANIHLQGVGLTTGDRYVANGASTLSGTYPPAGISIVTDVEQFHEIHPGETPTKDDYTSRMLLTRDGFVEQQSCT
jgi:hypothetical protein